jgi:DNA-binding transcriptional LysR family regulator
MILIRNPLRRFRYMRSINLDQLRTFVEVVSEGNFSAAGRRLNLTQPAVSLHVRALEQRVRLLERVGRRAYATAPGMDLAGHARRIFDNCELIESTMHRFRDGWLGRVRIGTTLTALTYLLPPVLQKLRVEYPGIDLFISHLSTRDSVDSVIKNTIDIALIRLPVKEPRLRITPLRLEKLVAIFPADSKQIPNLVTPDYAARQSLILEHRDGAVNALILQWLARLLPLSNQPMLLGTVEAMKTVVSLGLGIALVPDVSVVEPVPNIIVRPLHPSMPCTLALIERRDKPDDRALDIVRAAMLELRQHSRRSRVHG